MKRVVMTGATGAIGIALLHKCIAEGTEVLVLCRRDSRRNDRIPNHKLITMMFCDLTELKNFRAVSGKSYDVFYHFAWEATVGDGRNDMHRQLKNVEYALDAVALAERLGCDTFVGAGSQAEYGRAEGRLTESTPVNPENGYGMAKLCAGQMVTKECEKRGMRSVWVRILSVYGPCDGDSSMISVAGRALLGGRTPQFTKGEQKWDYLYSQDAAEALWLLGETKDAQGVYVLGSGRACELKEYIHQLRDAVNPSLDVGIGELPYTEKQVMYLCADISRLTADTGFVPKTEFVDGIRKTVQWMKTV